MPRQTSFNGGQIDALLLTRSDLDFYSRALKTCRNFIPTVSGSLIDRPGFEDLGEVKHALTSYAQCVLVPFSFSDDQSFVLEVSPHGDNYCTVRVWKNGEVIADTRTFDAWDDLASYSIGATVSNELGGHTNWQAIADNTHKEPGSTDPTVDGTDYWVPVSDVGEFELAIPWSASIDLSKTRFAQSGDVVTLVHPDADPIEIRRYANADWRFESINFDGRPADFYGVEPKVTAVSTIETDESTGVDSNALWSNSDPINLPPLPWRWKITSIARDRRGRMWESAPFTVAKVRCLGYPIWDSATNYIVGDKVSLDKGSGRFWECVQAHSDVIPNGTINSSNDYWVEGAQSNPPHGYDEDLPDVMVLSPEKYLTLSWTATGLLYDDPNYEILYWRIYRGQGSLFGLVAEVEAKLAGVTWIDYGERPDYIRSPPDGRNPFKIYDADGDVLSTQRPSLVGFYEERRVFANLHDPSDTTRDRPTTMLASRTGDYANFDTHLIPSDDDAVDVEIAARRFEEIRALLDIGRLLLCCHGGPWTVTGKDDGPLSAAELPEAMPHGSRGAAALDAVSFEDGAAFFVQAQGPRVIEVGYSAQSEALGNRDLSLYAHDLFNGYTVKRLALQRDPLPVLWVLRSDGKLLSLTIDHAEKVVAWAWHDQAGSGSWLDICVVPEGAEDRLYALTQRTVGDGAGGSVVSYRIERMASRFPSSATGRRHLDGFVVYSGASTSTVTGLGHLEGQSVYALSAGTTHSGPYTVASGQVTLSAATTHAVVGLPITRDCELLDVYSQQDEVRHKQKNVVRAIFEVDAPDGIAVSVGETTDALSAGDVDDENRIEVLIKETWNRGGSVILRCTSSLPLAVLSAYREVRYGQ